MKPMEKTAHKTQQKPFKNTADLLPGLPTLFVWGAGVVLLNWLAGSDYRLFRVAVDEAALICAIVFGLLVGQTYHYIKDEYPLFTGYLLLIGAIFNLGHLWTVFRLGPGPPYQTAPGEWFWWGGSFLQGLGLCLAPFSMKSGLKRRLILGLLAVTALTAVVWLGREALQGGIRPIGGTAKIMGEGLILAGYGGALFFHYWRRQNLQPSMAFAMTTALGLLIVAEIGVFQENGRYQPVAVAGYILYLLAYGLILRGILLVSIKIPYEVIFKELKVSAIQDPLTGLLNRNGLNEFVSKELAGSAEKKQIGVLIMDLDGFKEINDYYGHARGDYLLVEFAKVLKSCVRGTDIVCRMGGDEFLVLVQAGQLELNMVRYRIQEAVASWRERDNTARQIGVSIGSSMGYSNQAFDLQHLLLEADQDMYWEKKKRKLLQKSGKKTD